jgi:hypothetical protein
LEYTYFLLSFNFDFFQKSIRGRYMTSPLSAGANDPQRTVA